MPIVHGLALPPLLADEQAHLDMAQRPAAMMARTAQRPYRSTSLTVPDERWAAASRRCHGHGAPPGGHINAIAAAAPHAIPLGWRALLNSLPAGSTGLRSANLLRGS